MSKEEKSSLWSQRIREFRSSGQTCKDWCGEHQLPVSTMTYWIRKLKREEESAGDAGPVFAKLPSEAEIAMRDTAENNRILLMQNRLKKGQTSPLVLLTTFF